MPDLAISQETGDEFIDRANAAGSELEVNLQKIESNLVDKLAAAITSVGHSLFADILKDENNIIAGLDGWTLDVHATIRLTKPK